MAIPTMKPLPQTCTGRAPCRDDAVGEGLLMYLSLALSDAFCCLTAHFDSVIPRWSLLPSSLRLPRTGVPELLAAVVRQELKIYES